MLVPLIFIFFREAMTEIFFRKDGNDNGVDGNVGNDVDDSKQLGNDNDVDDNDYAREVGGNFPQERIVD